MEVNHTTLVSFAKNWGLFYFMGLFIIVAAYACWPSNKKRFDRIKNSILESDDRPKE